MQRLVNDSLVLAGTWIQRALSVPMVPLCSQDNTTHKFLGSKPRSLVGAGTRIIVLLDTAGFGCCTAITLCDVCLWLNCPIQKSYMIFTWFYNSPTRRQVKLTRYKRRARMSLSASDRFTASLYSPVHTHQWIPSRRSSPSLMPPRLNTPPRFPSMVLQ